MLRRVRHLIEFAFARLFLFLIDVLPLRVACGLFAGLADLWYALGARRRRIAQDNIRRSGIASEPAEVRRIARAAFRHLGVLAVESLKCQKVLTDATWQDHVTESMPAETRALFEDETRSLILVSGHLGNWEVAAQLLSFVKPVVGITRGMNNPYTNRLMEKRKPSDRFRLTPKHDAHPGRLLSVLKRGEILAMLIDQYSRKRFGTPIDFFGHPAYTHKSPAMLHLLSKAPIVFGSCIRTGPLQYRFEAGKPLVFKPTGNREADVQAILTALTAELEKAIRAAPEQYLWLHRRWR